MAAAAIPAQVNLTDLAFNSEKRALRKEQARFSLIRSIPFHESLRPPHRPQLILKTPRPSFLWHRYLRLFVVAIAIASCVFVIRSAATFGFSRLLVTYSLTSGNLAAAKKAIQLTPKDAEAHFAGAALMSLSGAPDQVSRRTRARGRLAASRLWTLVGARPSA